MDSTIKETHNLGIDIAKHKFDVALSLKGKYKNKVVDNNHAGFMALTGWLAQHQACHVHACMEATGSYWEAIATYG